MEHHLLCVTGRVRTRFTWLSWVSLCALHWLCRSSLNTWWGVLRSRCLFSFCFCRVLVEKCDFEKKCLSPESTFLSNLLSHQHFMVFARQSESLVFVFPFRMVQRILNQEAKCQGKRGWCRSLTENFPSPPSSLILFPPVCLRCSDVEKCVIHAARRRLWLQS